MKTRIKVVSSQYTTEYHPQYKGLFCWHDMYDITAPFRVNRYMRILLGAPGNLKPLSLELAQYMIDKALEQENIRLKDKKHKKEAKTSYVKYP